MSVRELEIVECDSPVSEPRRRQLLVPRASLRKILHESGWSAPIESTKILLDGEEVPYHMWGTIVPRPGSTLVFVRRSHVEGFAAVVAFFGALAKSAASAFTLGSISGGAVSAGGAAGVSGAIVSAANVGAAIGSVIGSVGLSFAIGQVASLIIGRPNQDVDPIDGGPESPTLQGASNGVRPNAPFPYVAGTCRIIPPFGAFPFTFVRGSESVFQAIFIAGRGRLFVRDPLIGDTSLSTFNRFRSNVRHSLNSGDPNLGAAAPPSSALGIYTNKVFQAALNSTFDPIPFGSAQYFSPHVNFRVPGQGHSRLGVDFNFPGGLAVIRDKGPRDYFFGVEIEYKKASSGVWTNAANEADFGPLGLEGGSSLVNNSLIGNAVQYVGQSSRPFQTGITWTINSSLAPGPDDEWDIRVRRVERSDPRVLPGGSETNTTFGTFIWFAAKGFNFNSPALDPAGVATYELEIPLDTQFNGLTQNLSLLVSRYVRIYDPGNILGSGIDADGWTLGYYISSNPAAIIRDMLQGENNRRPVPDSKLNIGAFTFFYLYCSLYNEGGLTGGLQFNFVFDARMDLFEACNIVAQAGRGKFGQDSQGRFSVIFDGPILAPVAKISAANARAFSMELTMPRKLHAIRCSFVDQDSGFDTDAEEIVYADGFSALNADENFIESLSFPGVTRRAQIYLLARYFIAERIQRRRVVSIEQGLEHLQYGTGQLVSFSHPGALIGIGCEGRIKSASAAVYRDLFDQSIPPLSEGARQLSGCTVVYGDLSGPVARGQGAGKVTATGSGLATITTVVSTVAARNFNGCRFDLSAMAGNASSLSSGDGIRVRFVGPTTGDWKEWRFGTADGLSAAALQQIGQALSDAADATAGTYVASQTRQIEIHVNAVSGAAGRTFRVNDFRVSDTSTNIHEVELDQLASFAVSQSYELEYRREIASIANQITRVFLKNLADFEIVAPRRMRFVYFNPGIVVGTTEPLEGNLFTFGDANVSTARMICRDKLPGPDLTARVVLVDEAPGVHNVTATIPPFSPGTTLPVPIKLLGPAKPEILQFVSDERAILVLADGTLKPRILLHVIPGMEFGRPPADFYSVHYRRILPSILQGVALPRVDASTTEIILDDVEEGASYAITIQAVTRDGRTSEPNVLGLVGVIGKSARPPNVQQFRLEGTELRWTLPNAPPDLAGFKIKKGPIGGTYFTARWITEPMLVAAPPFPVDRIPDPGNAVLYIVAVDTVGNESAIPALLSGFIGVPPAKNVVRTVDIDAAGFGIIDQVEPIVSGFEALMRPPSPQFLLVPTVLPGEEADPVTVLATDLATGTLDVERTIVDEGMQSLKVQRSSAAAGYVNIVYAAGLNVTKRKIQGRFQGAKAAVTWTVSYRAIQFDDITKWSRWDVTGLATQTWVDANVDFASAPTATNGGGADLTKIGMVEVMATPSSISAGDIFYLDNLRWVGGTVNGVEVVSGDLKTMAVASNFWNNDLNADFWNSNLSADFWGTTTYLSGIYEFEVEILSADLPGDVRISMSDPGVDFQIFYKLPSGTEFMPFPGVLELPEDGFYRFKILLAGGFVQASIDQLAVIVDVDDQVEMIANFSVASTGTVRLPITKSYRSIAALFPHVRGSTPAVLIALDYQTTIGSGPSVQVLNSTTGTRIAASVDVEVRGVKG